ncbi:MAG: N-acetyltransferase [Candidatus Lokiarchaeia archaeon]|nr:N-acetyltransferase [Candidatus Lokiarchaeia archaeon]
MDLIEIKNVKSKDLKQIVNLENRTFKKNAFSKDLLKSLIKNNTLFLKLETGKVIKKIIGFLIAIRDKKERVNIINLLIKFKFQNKGYGSYLLQKAINEIRKMKGVKKIVLNVQISNLAAINLYEKFKFKKKPDILEHYYQSGENAYLMELEID